MTGDPLQANLPADCRTDIAALDDRDFDLMAAGDLLEGNEPEACGPEFSTWLLVERARTRALVDEKLRREILSCLSTMDKERALQLAQHFVQRDPFDESRHVLLVKALALSGELAAARTYVDNVEADFLRELGERPSSALRAATRPSGPTRLAAGGLEKRVDTLIEAGKAALAAGAADAGVDCLRNAVEVAGPNGNAISSARAMVELGTALIHAVRGYDDEGNIYLRRAEELAIRADDHPIACRAILEQSYSNALAGRRPDAKRLSQRAFELADKDDESLSTAYCFFAFNHADWGHYQEAYDAYDRCLELARTIGARRRETWALGLGSWAQLRNGNIVVAEQWAKNAIILCGEQRWLSFRPWPEAVLAEVELVAKSATPSNIRSRLEATLALSCQISDPCWEAAACRVIGLSYWAEAYPDLALSWLERGLQAVTRVTDPYTALWTRISLDQARISSEVQGATAEILIRGVIGLAARTHADTELSEALELLGQVQKTTLPFPGTER
jgi:tetratricopeptide (TPR) repeat protein